jgi:hypothetical protein
MGVVVRFPGHKLHHCERDCAGCMFCEGGLAYCVTCGGGEGSLPTDCPGYRMPQPVERDVYAGVLDYRRVEGWTIVSNGRARFKCT